MSSDKALEALNKSKLRSNLQNNYPVLFKSVKTNKNINH
jgi:hypothetical protein